MIEAYCSRQSYRGGEQLSIHVSTSAAAFSVRIVRYRRDPDEMYFISDVPGQLRPLPGDVVERGCNWPSSHQLQIPDEWQSGFYQVLLESTEGETAETFFVVRAGVRRNGILWVIETNTWNAYNNFGGASTYIADETVYANGANRVSFDRPLPAGTVSLPHDAARLATVGPADTSIPYVGWSAEHGFGVFTGAASWGQWGAKFADWLEDQNIEVDFAVSSDLEEFSDILDGYDAYVSAGHDEYWSWSMRDAVEAFIGRGGNAIFLSGNTSFWQVRLEDERKTMVAYKAQVDQDPVIGTKEERRNTGIWSHRLTRRPENEMTGLSFTRGGYARFAGATPSSSGGYTVYRHEHWALAGTGLSFGDLLGGAEVIVGYECDGCAFTFQDGLPVPTGGDGTPENFEIIGLAPVTLWDRKTAPPGYYPDDVLSDVELVAQQMVGSHEPVVTDKFIHGHAMMGTFVTPSGGQVFNAGTTDWVFGLSNPQVSRITRNVLERFANLADTAAK